MTIDTALRSLLRKFRLPGGPHAQLAGASPFTVSMFNDINLTGEAQKIDRIMEKFAERYCKDNKKAFARTDSAYLLAFAIIMLNTDAHNPMADKKLSCQDFVQMCQNQVSLLA